MKRVSFSLWTTVALVALGSLARADDGPWSSLDELSKKRGNAAAFLVVVAKSDAEETKTVEKLLAEPKLAKLLKDVSLARIDPGDEPSSKTLGVAVEKTECLLSFDGYLVPVTKHTKAVTTDTLASLLKQAEDATAKKKKVEKKLGDVLARGEGALKKGDTKTACEQFLGVIDYKATVPCAAVDTAEKHVGELTQKGLALLTQARAATKKKDFSQSHKLIGEATNDYPTPEVLAEAKNASAELGVAEKNATGK
jgi:hypothetical protein